MFHIKLREKKYGLTLKQTLWPYTHTTDQVLRVRLKSDIEIVHIGLFFIELTAEN